MKKLSLILILLLSLSGFSQQREFHKRDSNRSTMTSEQRATLMSKQMALNLELSAAQQKEVKELMKQEAELRQARKEEYIKMKEEGAERTKTSRYEMMNARLDKQLAFQQKMKKVLNEEQYETWKKSMHHQLEKRRSFREGRRRK
ncbi:hypothetical protein L1I30_04340 [Gillisia sp. M10.2A]|uniref:DUF4890 domain-containing protein n=1 Tax=Gillisia lutea TaxID=2909668 RepID=A0ABS9EDM9_9FLAO|nr:hypothetical protein [Gillisia lutea]MCF4100888.1 hypothetical protein [Gillisia lutea]